MKKPMIKNAAVLIILSDGVVHQVALTDEMEQKLLNDLTIYFRGPIQVFRDGIDSVFIGRDNPDEEE